MDKKKIEPTDAMVDEAANALALETTGTALHLQSDAAKHTYRHRARVALRVVLNHPGAAGPFAADAARPWEPLNGLPRVGDEVRQDYYGITHTAVVGRVDEDGEPWTTEDGFIGQLDLGTWWVRHAVQPLPPERDGVVLVAADGHESITTTDGQEFSRLTYSKELSKWYGPNLAQLGEYVIQATSLSRLIPGTWKVDDQ